jgi:hypothetical protein
MLISLKKMSVAVLCSTTLFAAQAAYATDEDRVDHYERIEITSWKHAQETLKNQSQEMAQAISEKDWERVHELSYDLEEAIIYMQKDLKNTAALLEEVHLGSEGETPENIPDIFKKYNASALKYTE